MIKLSRSIHFGRRITLKQNKTASEITLAAKNLRHCLGQANTSSIEPLLQLGHAIQARDRDSEVPKSTYGLISRTLDKINNYKSVIGGSDLQMLFRSLAQENQIKPATKLYMDIYRHSQLNPDEKIENGFIYFKMLRATGYSVQADQMVKALFKENFNVVTEKTLMKFLTDIKLNPKSTQEDAAATLNLIKSSQYAYPQSPPMEVLTQSILLLSHLGDKIATSHLNSLVEYIYFTNSHFDIAPQTAIVLLDAYLQLPTGGQPNGGHKVLGILMSYLHKKNVPDVLNTLETYELLLMSCIHFQQPVTSAQAVYDQIIKTDSEKYSKETWDILVQYVVYRSDTTDNLNSLRRIIDRMPKDVCDAFTFRQALRSAFMAQYNENQIQKIVNYFESELEIIADASVHEILIRRALTAVEVDKARQIFSDSNADWNMENNKYLGVLSDLLIALSKTNTIPRQDVVECYQKVRLFTTKVSYEAQLALLQMFLHESTGGSVTPAGVFLIEQFGEVPNLPFENHKEIFELFYQRILSTAKYDQAWDLFGVLNCTIVLPYEAYYPIQRKFCSLGRPDAAHLMFRQLRNRAKNSGTRPPGEEMYLMLFHQYAINRYEEGIHELDTYFRMDLNNEMSIKMMNQMMLAYSALQDSHKVSHLWNEALSLPRGGSLGPNDETICIMLQFFSKNLGLEVVDDLWMSLPTKFKLEPTSESLRQYVIANCYHGFYMRALEIVKMAPNKYGIAPDNSLLISLYNWTLLPTRKHEVKHFIQSSYPELWHEIESSGKLLEIVIPVEDLSKNMEDSSEYLATIKQLEEAEQVHTQQVCP